MNTTLNQIRDESPCADGWKKLLTHLGKTQADDEALSILTILESNGLADALWCLRSVTGHDREIRLYTVWCARQVESLMTDQRSIDALDVAERFANGLATDEELAAASFAAWAAASDTGSAASDAARADASLAAGFAAGFAASDAGFAASFAASDAARAASAASDAGSAARAAARAAQEKRLREDCAEIDAAIAQQTKEKP